MREVTPGIVNLYLRYLKVAALPSWSGVNTETYYKLYITDIGTNSFVIFNCLLDQITDFGLDVTYSFRVREKVGVYAHKVSYTEGPYGRNNKVHLDRDDYGVVWWITPGKGPTDA